MAALQACSRRRAAAPPASNARKMGTFAIACLTRCCLACPGASALIHRVT